MSDARKKSSGETTTCSWCSAVIPVEAATCPSCGAALRDAADGDVAGVTQVDIAATYRHARM
jgi:predicted amidophosphoribosyltransferase